MKNRGSVYSACIRPFFLYGVETWSITNKLEETLQSCGRRVLRYMADVSLSVRVASNEVAIRCDVKPLLQHLRDNRLGRFGHAKRRRGACLLGEVIGMEVTGPRPGRRTKEILVENIEEDLCKLHLMQDDAYDRDRWKTILKRQTHYEGTRTRKTEKVKSKIP